MSARHYPSLDGLRGTAILLVLLTITFSPFAQSIRTASGDRLRSLWLAQPALWTYTLNLYVATRIDTIRWSLWIDAVLVLWSLAIEEQFYLVVALASFRFLESPFLRLIRILIDRRAGRYRHRRS